MAMAKSVSFIPMTELMARYTSGTQFARILKASDVSNADLEYLVDHITSGFITIPLKQWDMLADIFEALLEERQLSCTEEIFLAAFTLRFDTLFEIPDFYYPILTERVGTGAWMNILNIPGFTRPQGGLFDAILRQIQAEESVSALIDAVTTLQDKDVLQSIRLDQRILEHPMFPTCPIHQYEAACNRGLQCNPPQWRDYMILQVRLGPENVPDWTCKVAISFALLGTQILREFPRQLADTSHHTLVNGDATSPIWYRLSRGVKQVFSSDHVDLIDDTSIRHCIFDLMSHMIQSGNADAVKAGLLILSTLFPHYPSDCTHILTDLAYKLSRIFT